MNYDFGTVVARFRKNAEETTLVRLTEFKGMKFVDLRAFVAGENGEDVPTKKGLSVTVAQIPALIVALQDARQAAEDAQHDDRLMEGRHDREALDAREHGMGGGR